MKNFFNYRGMASLAMLALTACGGGGSDSSNESKNQAPTIVVSNQTVNENSPVVINATASDSDGTIQSYDWQQISGKQMSVSGGNTSTIQFTAPDIDADESLVFRLTVTDDVGASSSQQVSVLVKKVNQVPTVSAGDDQHGDEGQTIQLVATGNDKDGTVSYRWSQVSGDIGQFSDPNAAEPMFTLPNINVDTQLTLMVEVTDNDGAKATDLMTVFARWVNAAPVVDAGADQDAISGKQVTLSGTVTDPENGLQAVQWQQTSGPAVQILDPKSSQTEFVAPLVTEETLLSFTLTATDIQGLTTSDVITVNVKASLAIAEPDRTTDLQIYTFGELPSEDLSDKFDVSIDGKSLTVLQTIPPIAAMSPKIKPGTKDGADSYRDTNRSFAWSQFSFDAAATSVDVTIEKLADAGSVTDILVRPTALAGVAYQIIEKDLAAKTIKIRVLQSNRKLSVEFKDNRYAPLKDIPLDALLLFADRTEREDIAPVPDKSANTTYVVENGDVFDREVAKTKQVVYFAPGTHNISYWQVPSNVKQVYLAGGAYVMGAINADHNAGPSKGYTISGRGVISGEKFPWRADKTKYYVGSTLPLSERVCVNSDGYSDGCPREGIKLLDAEQDELTVEGLTLVNGSFYVFGAEADSNNSWAKISNIKMLGNWRYNNDGFDVGTGTEMTDCFVSPMDDAFKIYHSNAVIKDCVVWQMDNGGMFQFGWFPKTVKNVLIENIHVLHTEWTGLNKNRGLANLTERPAGDSRTGKISDITLRNVWMEGPTSRVIYLRNEFYPNQSYDNWLFENIHVDYMPTYNELVSIKNEKLNGQTIGGNGQLQSSLLLNAIEDFNNGNGSIKNIRFKNFNINGALITNDNASTIGLFDKLQTDNTSDVNFE
ncbi:hypothetical protein C2869_07705 [Saccharobesus litoralis]|uniref:PKD/Chitinase domain-containing protein n=1 Tax=Saccharobesus litoralis TaxID=2172099 RepID=A0A2S0VQ37_9ALTE|nr:hypothetical protein [Saccharobesus litoralis]AWB66324.1 hypothetical protein C2869_07705 [Saccharobesus litoralis]